MRDLDLDIRDGELMVVVGPSGCGKSTLLRLLAGLEEISHGTLRIGQTIANHLSPQARNIAMVFQDYALYPTMTVRENLAFPLRMRKLGAPEIRRRVQWMLDLLDLGNVQSRLPRELSGGQRQRVAMGRALVREPAVFLLDEPLSNLDAQLRAQVRADIADLQLRTGATMVYVTHDQVEAMTLGQRIAVLSQGTIQQVAAPRDLYETPANAFVAGFIGSPPMNVFTARLKGQSDGGWALVVAGQTVAFAPAEALPQAGNRDGLKVSAGIRPETLRLAGAAEPGFLATALSSEYLGHETLVYCWPGVPVSSAARGQPWIARLSGLQPLARGTTLRLAVVAPCDIRLFGPCPDSA